MASWFPWAAIIIIMGWIVLDSAFEHLGLDIQFQEKFAHRASIALSRITATVAI